MTSNCPICNKEGINWRHSKHINSKQHQDALTFLDRKPINVDEGVKSDEGPQCDIKCFETYPTVTFFDIFVENFETLCKKKIIIGTVRVRIFEFIIKSVMDSFITEKALKTLLRLRKQYF